MVLDGRTGGGASRCSSMFHITVLLSAVDNSRRIRVQTVYWIEGQRAYSAFFVLAITLSASVAR